MLTARVLKELTTYHSDAKTWWVAYSGGLDSSVLLHVMAELRVQLSVDVKALHINHGLSENANVWQQHCEQTCANLNIPFQTFQVNAHPKIGESPEAAAREARYQVFEMLLQTNELLLTAHHQDDQAETLLLQLLRGAGVKGLAAMPVYTRFSKGHLLRPLLASTRKELAIYAQQHHLQWLDDESNADARFNRNYLRHRLLPIIQERWPMASKVIARTAQHCAEAAELMTELAATDRGWIKGSSPNVLLISKLHSLSPARQRNVIRYWLASLHLSTPNAKHIEQVLRTVLNCTKDAVPKVTWAGAEIRRYRDNLYALSTVTVNTMIEISWTGCQPLTLPNHLGQLTCEFKLGQGIKKEWLEQPLTIRFRKGGERCQPKGRPGSHPLKKCFQEWGVPPWQRDKIPLLYAGEHLLAVVGYCICERFAAAADELGGVITLD